MGTKNMSEDILILTVCIVDCILNQRSLTSVSDDFKVTSKNSGDLAQVREGMHTDAICKDQTLKRQKHNSKKVNLYGLSTHKYSQPNLTLEGF